MKKPVALIIMDGYGIAPDCKSNAVTRAKKPNIDMLMSTYPNTLIEASGEAVGLPDGQMGNSEVGHMNLGAGRVVYQSLTKINVSLKDGSFNKNEVILSGIDNALKNNKKFHIIGLCSDGGIHSHTTHINAIVELAKSKGVNDVYYHAILDGRDVAPNSANEFISKIESSGAKIATVSGRYYAMDRDKNWNRIQLAYDAMTTSVGEKFSSAAEGINVSYKRGVLDEFVVPFIVEKKGRINNGDTVIFANFRPDRAIQLATALSNPEYIKKTCTPENKLDVSNAPKNLNFISMMKYSDNVIGQVAFKLEPLVNLFGEVVANNNLKQLRIAETEKYAHVTFFFDGGVDKEIKGSDRVLINSPKVETYDLKPEMSAFEVCDKVVEAILSKKYDSMIINFANCDMVGHTGNIEASIKAVEAVDTCIGRIYEALQNVGGVALITSDHGNAEMLLDDKDNVFTAHTSNKVPFLITDKNVKLRQDGVLSDITITMLDLLGVEIPKEMTSKTIIIK
ncbi:MAG: 2,3-bisphosphoglycerate-independent phosphoglycerate mutase [Anaeroplasmataceae bacterium]